MSGEPNVAEPTRYYLVRPGSSVVVYGPHHLAEAECLKREFSYLRIVDQHELARLRVQYPAPETKRRGIEKPMLEAGRSGVEI